jgi:hypothetical protein
MTCDCTHAIVRLASAIPDGFNSYSGLGIGIDDVE